MAKYLGSQWGIIKGKLGNRVGTTWKGMPYLRVHFIPKRSNSPAQARSRLSFKDMVKFGNMLPLSIYYKYADRRCMVVVNVFIKYNHSQAMKSTPAMGKPYSPLVLRVFPVGDIDPTLLTEALYNPDTGEVNLRWETTVSRKGKPDDKIWAAVHSVPKDAWFLVHTNKVRADGEATVTILPNRKEPLIAHIYPVVQETADYFWEPGVKLDFSVIPKEPAKLLSTGDTRQATLTKIFWQYGETGVPGSGPDQLYGPANADYLANGHILIADVWNHRVIEVDRGKNIVKQWNYFRPRDAEKLGTHILISSYGIHELNMLGIEVWTYDVRSRLTWAVKQLENGNRLFSAPGGHVLREVDKNKNTVWEYGQWDNPGGGFNELNGPGGIQRLANENTLIADRNNHRVIEVTPDKEIIWQYGEAGVPGFGDNQLSRPLDAELIDGNMVLIADTGNSRVIKVTKEKRIVWQYGETGIPGSGINQLKVPRAATLLPNNRVLITDGANQRVIEVG